MPRRYAVTFDNVAVAAAQDLFELQPADDLPIRVVALYLAQSSDFGDAEEEILRVHIVRGNATIGSGGASATPAPLDPGDPAASVSAAVNNTTEASAGTEEVLHADAFNVRVGMQFIPDPDSRPGASQANTILVVRLLDAPTDSLTMTGTLVIEEG